MQDKKSREIIVTVPQLAESVVSATVSKWLKQPGDHVIEYEPICEIVTDKVTAELPSTVSGTLVKIMAEEGDTLDVGTALCIIETEDEGSAHSEEPVETDGSAYPGESDQTEGSTRSDTSGHAEGSTRSGASIRSEGSAQSEGIAQSAAAEQSIADHGQSQPTQGHEQRRERQPMRHRYSPAVRTLAEEYNLNLEEIVGTGLGGRVTRKDVLQFIEAGPSAPLRSTGLHLASEPAPLKQVAETETATATNGQDYFIKVNPIRNTIATRMRQSVSEIPHAWTMIEVDTTNLVALRNKLKKDFMEQEGVNLTYLSFIIKAVVNAIKDYPIMNSIWAVDNIIVKREINISLVVGTEDAVYVPVIKHADEKNIAGLAKEIDSLTKKVRTGKLTAEDVQGGTFTVNNTGSFGSILSYPIINYPQAANFTFESIVKRPVVIDDMIAVRSMANLCLSLDHRILDGVICGRFMQRVKENIEAYGPDTKLY